MSNILRGLFRIIDPQTHKSSPVYLKTSADQVVDLEKTTLNIITNNIIDHIHVNSIVSDENNIVQGYISNAQKDILGNTIDTTYATKAQLSALDNTLVHTYATKSDISDLNTEVDKLSQKVESLTPFLNNDESLVTSDDIANLSDEISILQDRIAALEKVVFSGKLVLIENIPEEALS